MRKTCLDELAAAIVAIPLDRPTRVGIDGVDASGKTTLADELVDPIRRLGRDVIRASVDGFHNPRAVRYVLGADSPEGYFRDSFDYGALRSQLLEPIASRGGLFRTAVFDHRVDAAVSVPCRSARPDAILLFDGVFLQRPELEGLWDATIWVEAPFEITVERAVLRDARNGVDSAEVREKYARRYVPGQRLYLARCRPDERADFVINNSDPTRPTIVRRPDRR